VLLATLYFLDGSPNSDAAALLYYGMLVLCFPISVVVSTIVGILARIAFETTGYTITTTVLWTITIWLLFLVPGYWQWFVLLPKLRVRWSWRTAR
jgi:hypothetical protein